MNFDMAGETVELEDDIESTTVLLADDVVSAPPEEAEKRRGVAGMVYAFKCAGAKAEQMADLDEVTRVAQKTADACRSIGMALTPCTVPQAGKPTFEIGEDEMEMGMGIHGEPGIWRDKLKPADAITDEMIDRLLADKPLGSGDRISLMVNSSRRDAARKNFTSCIAAPRRAWRMPGVEHRHAAGRALWHLHGDDRRDHHAL